MSLMLNEIYQLLNQLGNDMELVKVTEGSYSPEFGLSSASNVSYDCVGKLIEYSEKEMFDSRIQVNDRKCLISAKDLAVTPDPTDMVIDGNDTYNIIRIQVIKEGNTAIAFVCQVRN